MTKSINSILFTISACAALYLSGNTSDSQACTRALYVGSDNTVITGRSMDWTEDMHSDLWVFPRGIQRNGEAGPNSAQWTSKYGSVVASVYNLVSADGMNEKGLVMNMLYLVETDYGKPVANHPPLSISLWGQYTLDNFASVSEAVNALQANPFYIIAPNLPNGTASQVHLSLSDPSGDSAIFEYINGQLVIHHGKEYQVMTNSPIYSKQLALNEYWQDIGGNVFLPGTARAADRFARTFFFLNNIPNALDPNYIKSVPNQSYANQALASVLSVIRAVSVPFGITTPNEPNIAATIWRTMSDQKNLVYYFDSSTSPNTFWVTLANLNFEAGAPILKLPLDAGQTYAGDADNQFKPAPAFQFLPAEVPKT
ncbi:MAG: linear amide C-N hydrolase [Legionellaceae bacterium]|nr:linear amide C-N hydrolase [Legionellaceae bacterium]